MLRRLVFAILGVLCVMGGASLAYAATPVITSITPVQGLWKENGFIYISGENFPSDRDDLSVQISNKNAHIEELYHNQLKVQLPTDVPSGDVIVKVAGESSAPYYLELPRPEMYYVYRPGGVVPGTEVEIGGKKLLTVGVTSEVWLGKTQLAIRDRDFANQRIIVELPNEPIQEELRVLSNGLYSNPVELDIAPPFYVTGALMGPQQQVEVYGLFPSEKELSVFLDTLRLTVSQYTTTKLLADFPDGDDPVGDGFVSVRYGDKKSANVLLTANQAPTVYGIGDMKRIFQPEENEEDTSKVYYELEILLIGDATGTDIYMNDQKMEVVRRTGSAVTIHTTLLDASGERTRTPFPVKGTLFAVVQGNKGREYTYDVTDRLAPVLYRLEAPEGFGSRKKIIILGDRLGDTASSVIVNSSHGLQLNEDNEPMLISHSNGRIEFRLPDLTGVQTNGKISVTVRGLKSNEITYPMNLSVTEVNRDPYIKEISFPNGQTPGSQMVIRGLGFSTFRDGNRVSFNGQIAIPDSMNGTDQLFVTIPAGATSGDITVEVQGRKSKAVDAVIVPSGQSKIQWFFEEPLVLSVAADDAPVAVVTLGVRNLFQRLVLNKLRLDIEWNDTADPGSPYAVKNSGILPIEYVEFKLGNTTYRSAVKRQGSSYYVEFQGVTIPVAEEKQLLELKVQFASHATSLSTMKFAFDPNLSTYLSGLFPDSKRAYESTTGQGGVLERSSAITILNPDNECIEAEDEKNRCSARTASMPNAETIYTPSTQRDPTLEEIKEERTTTIPRSEESLIPTFTDTAQITWAQEALRRLSEQGVIQGFPDHSFRPTQLVTRAELVKMILLAQEIKVGTSKEATGFKDVKATDWFVTYLSYAKNKGIIQGYGDGSFRPNAPVSRAEAVKIILSAAGESLLGVSTARVEFTDVTGWALPWIQKAASLGVVKGYSDGSFKPQASLTRVEAAQMVSFFLE